MARVCLFIALLGLAGCTQNPIKGLDMFDDYSVLSIPRSAINIGAEWQEGIGPNGPGLDASSLMVSHSHDTVESNSNFGVKAGGALLDLMKLSGGIRNKVEVRLENVEVVTVADLSKVKVEAGNAVLYEGIRVGKISMRTEPTVAFEVRDAAIKKFGLSAVTVDADRQDVVVIDAKNVYVAYRIVRFAASTVKTTSTKFTTGLNRKLGGYTFQIYPDDAFGCMCEVVQGLPITVGNNIGHPRRNTCMANKPLKISAFNPALGPLSSGGLKTSYLYPWGKLAKKPILLNARTRDGYFETDTLEIDATFSQTALSCMPFAEEMFNDDHSVLTLNTVRYKFSTDRSAKAPGW